MPIKDMLCKELLASKSSLTLKEKWFSSYKFLTNTLILDERYKYLRLKHKLIFYFLNNQLNYGLAHYFIESETFKGRVNKFITDLLMALLIKKLSYKNTDK